MRDFRKRILLIGYHYPPYEGVGATRIYKAAEYLRDRYQVHVLTGYTEPTRDHALDGVTVHYVPELLDWSPKRFDKISWVPKVVRAVQKLDTKYDYDVIWQTANPFLPLIALPIIKRQTGTPYIVDLRDSWTLMPYTRERTIFGKLNDVVSTLSEPRVLRDAAATTTATDGITATYKDVYPKIHDSFTTVPNGFDQSEYPKPDDIDQDDSVVTLFYSGKFSWYRDVEPLMAALGDIQESVDIELRHAGHPEDHVLDTAGQYGVRDSVQNLGYLNNQELAEELYTADLCLAISGGSRQEMTTKIFDYLACERPILAIGPKDGAMCNVVCQFEFGYTVRNSKPEIVEGLEEYLSTTPQKLGDGPYDDWTRQQTASQLSDVIESVTTA